MHILSKCPVKSSSCHLDITGHILVTVCYKQINNNDRLTVAFSSPIPKGNLISALLILYQR